MYVHSKTRWTQSDITICNHAYTYQTWRTLTNITMQRCPRWTLDEPRHTSLYASWVFIEKTGWTHPDITIWYYTYQPGWTHPDITTCMDVHGTTHINLDEPIQTSLYAWMFMVPHISIWMNSTRHHYIHGCSWYYTYQPGWTHPDITICMDVHGTTHINLHEPIQTSLYDQWVKTLYGINNNNNNMHGCSWYYTY